MNAPKRCPAILLAFCLLACCCMAQNPPTQAVSAPVVPAEPIALFNGKDLSGWTFCLRSNANPAFTWTVTNGVIHCTGQPFGYMRTEKSYRDYRLTVEWRFINPVARADNSGVFVHIQPPDQVWPRCIECQGQFKHQGDLILMNGASCMANGKSQTGRVALVGEVNEKAAGEWNVYRIECAGDTLKVFVNDKLLNEATDCSVSSGAIGIQSEGGEYEVRKVLLEPLSKQQ